MRLQKIKLMTGTVLSLVVAASTVSPAFAQSVEVAQTQRTSTTVATEEIIGYVRSIVGEVVTIREEKAPYRTLRIEKRVLGITGLVPGMKVKATVARGSTIVQQLVVLPIYTVTASAAPVRSTTSTTTRTQTQTTPLPPRPTPRPVPPPVSRPQTTPPAPRPVPVQPASPVRGLW